MATASPGFLWNGEGSIRTTAAGHRSAPAICASPQRKAWNLNFKCQMPTVTGSPGNYRARNIWENNFVMF